MSLIQKTLTKKAFLTGIGQNIRTIHASPSSMKNDNFFKQWVFNVSGYNKLGLLKDDMSPISDPDVREAYRRLPDDFKMHIKYRVIRAMQCDVNRIILPKEQWSKFEDDHDYLQPYLEEVRQERKEREEWEATY